MLVNHMSTLKVITFKTNNIYCVERRGLQLHLKIDKNESISIHGKLAREDSCTDSIISEGLWWGCGFQVIGMIQGTPWSDPSCIPRTNCHSIPWFPSYDLAFEYMQHRKQKQSILAQCSAALPWNITTILQICNII